MVREKVIDKLDMRGAGRAAPSGGGTNPSRRPR
jgi:hypothetical protein